MKANCIMIATVVIAALAGIGCQKSQVEEHIATRCEPPRLETKVRWIDAETLGIVLYNRGKRPVFMVGQLSVFCMVRKHDGTPVFKYNYHHPDEYENTLRQLVSIRKNMIEKISYEMLSIVGVEQKIVIPHIKEAREVAEYMELSIGVVYLDMNAHIPGYGYRPSGYTFESQIPLATDKEYTVVGVSENDGQGKKDSNEPKKAKNNTTIPGTSR